MTPFANAGGGKRWSIRHKQSPTNSNASPTTAHGNGRHDIMSPHRADREDHGCREENALAEHAAQQGDGRNSEDPC